MGSKKTVILLAFLVLVAGALMIRSLRGTAPENEEQVVAALVDAMAKAAEERDIKVMRSHLSRRYKDPSGRDYAGINQILQYHYFRKGKISVYVASKEVTVDSDVTPPRAEIKAKVVLTRGGAAGKLSDLVPESGDAITFDVTMEKEDGTWMMVSAQWKGMRDPKELLE